MPISIFSIQFKHFNPKSAMMMSNCINLAMNHCITANHIYNVLYPFFSPQIKYKKDYEKSKAVADYNVLPASDNPVLRQLRYAGTILSDVSV